MYAHLREGMYVTQCLTMAEPEEEVTYRQIQDFNVGEKFKLGHSDFTEFIYLGSEIVGGRGEDTMLRIFFEFPYIGFGKGTMVLYADQVVYYDRFAYGVPVPAQQLSYTAPDGTEVHYEQPAMF